MYYELDNKTERYKLIIEGTNIGTWEWNVQTGECIFNERWANIIGYTLADLQPIDINTWLKFAHPDDLKKSEGLLTAHFAGETEFYECEARMLHKDGHWVWVLDKGKVITRTPDGKPEWMTGSHQEITERKNSELLINHYRNLLERTNDIANIGTWEIDLKNNIPVWSPVTARIHGKEADYSPTMEEAINFYPEGIHRDTISKAVEEAIGSGKSFDIELQLQTAQGELKWVRAIGISEFEDGKCVKIYGYFQDIDDKNKAHINLAIQEERFRQTFEYAAIGMALVGPDGKWLKVNKSVCNLVGYTEEELLSKTFQDITHPDDLEIDLNHVQMLLKGEISSYQIEKRYITKNGHIVWVLLAVSLVRDEAGNPIHFVSQIKDINQRKILEDKTVDQNKRLLNFSYIVSHNLRSHVSNIALMIDLIKTDYPQSAENEFFPLLEKASVGLKNTIGFLNEVTRINTQTEANLVVLSLSDFIKSAIENINAQIILSRTQIINNVSNDVSVIAVPAYLESIILNFLTNAIKYAHPDRSPVIELSCVKENGYIKLGIKDNGLGIDLALHRDKLFGMYKTFHANKDATGIGLFITKNQVEAMGGKIDVESEVNNGTKFTVYLKHETV